MRRKVEITASVEIWALIALIVAVAALVALVAEITSS